MTLGILKAKDLGVPGRPIAIWSYLPNMIKVTAVSNREYLINFYSDIPLLRYMSQTLDVTRSSFVIPFKASITSVAYTSKSNIFNLVFNNPQLIDITERGLIMKPRRVKKGALKEFRDTTPDTVPTLKDLTHKDLESLIDERNTDIFDSL